MSASARWSRSAPQLRPNLPPSTSARDSVSPPAVSDSEVDRAAYFWGPTPRVRRCRPEIVARYWTSILEQVFDPPGTVPPVSLVDSAHLILAILDNPGLLDQADGRARLRPWLRSIARGVHGPILARRARRLLRA